MAWKYGKVHGFDKSANNVKNHVTKRILKLKAIQEIQEMRYRLVRNRATLLLERKK